MDVLRRIEKELKSIIKEAWTKGVDKDITGLIEKILNTYLKDKKISGRVKAKANRFILTIDNTAHVSRINILNDIKNYLARWDYTGFKFYNLRSSKVTTDEDTYTLNLTVKDLDTNVSDNVQIIINIPNYSYNVEEMKNSLKEVVRKYLESIGIGVNYNENAETQTSIIGVLDTNADRIQILDDLEKYLENPNVFRRYREVTPVIISGVSPFRSEIRANSESSVGYTSISLKDDDGVETNFKIYLKNGGSASRITNMTASVTEAFPAIWLVNQDLYNEYKNNPRLLGMKTIEDVKQHIDEEPYKGVFDDSEFVQWRAETSQAKRKSKSDINNAQRFLQDFGDSASIANISTAIASKIHEAMDTYEYLLKMIENKKETIVSTKWTASRQGAFKEDMVVETNKNIYCVSMKAGDTNEPPPIEGTSVTSFFKNTIFQEKCGKVSNEIIRTLEKKTENFRHRPLDEKVTPEEAESYGIEYKGGMTLSKLASLYTANLLSKTLNKIRKLDEGKNVLKAAITKIIGKNFETQSGKPTVYLCLYARRGKGVMDLSNHITIGKYLVDESTDFDYRTDVVGENVIATIEYGGEKPFKIKFDIMNSKVVSVERGEPRKSAEIPNFQMRCLFPL